MDAEIYSPPEVYVMPGESHFATEPVIFRTILGSCVGVAIYSSDHRAAALCHPMLPLHPGTKSDDPHEIASGHRYVDFAIRSIAAQFDAVGIQREELCVKLFGGGDVLLTKEKRSRLTVGEMNCETALRVLEEEHLRVVAASLRGNNGVHIRFHTATGEVLLRRL